MEATEDDEIKELKSQIKALEVREKEGERGLVDLITAKTALLTTLINDQRGKFAKHICARSLSTSSLHSSRFGKHER